MEHVTSADGTRLALRRRGEGPAVVIVGGAMSTADAAADLAAALAAAGFEAVTLDRRARGASGDTRPFAPEREVEDLAAVLAVAGGPAAVLGHSSGAVLALLAASSGMPMRHLFLSEPPFRFGEGEPAADLPERLQALVDEGRAGEAITTFQLEGVGLPEPMVRQIRESEMFAALVPLAQSVVYDATLARAVSTPTEAMLHVAVPVTILRGVETFPVIETAVARLAERMPRAETVVVPESRGHAVHPEATARLIRERLS